MQDIHTHIVFGVDDGSKSLEISKELLKLEESNGVTKVVCTPHINMNTTEKIPQIIENFETLKKENPTNIELMLGSEVYYYDGFIQVLKDGYPLTYGGNKYVLLEFSTRLETPIADIVYEVKIAGFKPIVAHVERYPYLKNDDYLEIVSSGALLQVNAKSIASKDYKKQMKFLLKNDLVSFVSSDCHNLDSRTVDFTEAKKFIAKKYKKLYSKLFEQDFEF